MKYTYFILYAFIVSSCTQKIEHPELIDDVYKDLVVELSIASKSLEEEEKNLKSVKEELALAVPQTGQVKFSKKKVSDSLERITILKQQKMYFEIKIEQRIQYAQQKYSESLHKGGKPWPDKEEVEVYKNLAKFRRDKIEWDKNKNLKKSVPRGTNHGVGEQK